jgi:hypothetical protein
VNRAGGRWSAWAPADRIGHSLRDVLDFLSRLFPFLLLL